MAVKKPSTPRSTKLEKDVVRLTGLDDIPENSLIEAWPMISYTHRYTTGPFLLPTNAGALDWNILNNSNSEQRARVTIFKCPIGIPKTPVAPGPLVVTIAPGELIHNANTYPEGHTYEIQIECNSTLLFPSVSVWPGNYGVSIPGTTIHSGMFIHVMP